MFLVDQVPLLVRKDFIECVTYFAKEALDQINVMVSNDPKLSQALQSIG